MSQDSTLHRLVVSFIDPENIGEEKLERINQLIQNGKQYDRGHFTTLKGHPMYVSSLIISTRHNVSRVIKENYYYNFLQKIKKFDILSLRRPNLLGVQVPVSPFLAKTVKMRSDHSENLTDFFSGAKNGNFSYKSPKHF